MFALKLFAKLYLSCVFYATLYFKNYFTIFENYEYVRGCIRIQCWWRPEEGEGSLEVEIAVSCGLSHVGDGN